MQVLSSLAKPHPVINWRGSGSSRVVPTRAHTTILPAKSALNISYILLLRKTEFTTTGNRRFCGY